MVLSRSNQGFLAGWWALKTPHRSWAIPEYLVPHIFLLNNNQEEDTHKIQSMVIGRPIFSAIVIVKYLIDFTVRSRGAPAEPLTPHNQFLKRKMALV